MCSELFLNVFETCWDPIVTVWELVRNCFGTVSILVWNVFGTRFRNVFGTIRELFCNVCEACLKRSGSVFGLSLESCTNMFETCW